jgi:restriction system protein
MAGRWRYGQRSGQDHGRDWSRYSDRLKRLQWELDQLHYQSVFDPVSKRPAQHSVGFFTLSRVDQSQLTLDDLARILSPSHLGNPHGRDLLVPIDPPTIPAVPTPPNSEPGNWQFVLEQLERVESKLKEQQTAFEEIAVKDREMLRALTLGYERSERQYIEFLAALSLVRHYLPEPLFRPSEIHYDPDARVVLCDLEIPGFASLSIFKQRGETRKLVSISAAETRNANETILYSLCIRAGYLIGKSDINDMFDSIAVNARQQWFDTATGATREGVVASLHASKNELIALQLEHVDPKACFRHLKGIASPSIDQTTPIRPIFVMNTADNRVVRGRDVDAELEAETNLAAMPWEDFEHLVRQLFEWEFGRNGVQVEVTRASRDRGVDAIMFDPDPLRGGKYVLQAKRYTRTVDVSAVRDLYGTVVNEGANRGVLVTTSSFGPDAYEFAKGKPISLVDGPNLIAMLQRHGRKYRINLAEARRLGADAND